MDTLLAKRIGGAARAARKHLDLTQAEVAERAGIATEFYARIERGGTLPSVPTLVKLADVLAVSVDVLLARERFENPAHPAREPDPFEATAMRKRSREARLVLRRLATATPEALRLVRLLLVALENARRGGDEREPKPVPDLKSTRNPSRRKPR